MQLALSVLLVILSVTNAVAGSTYKFSNGNELIIDGAPGPGVYFRNDTFDGILRITNDRVSFPEIKEPQSVVHFFTSGGVWAITESGSAHKLSPEVAKFISGQPPAIQHSARYFKQGNRGFLLLSLKYSTPEGEVTGETYLVDNSGGSGLVDFKAYDLQTLDVQMDTNTLKLSRSGPVVSLQTLEAVVPRHIETFANGNRLVVRSYANGGQLTYFLPAQGRPTAIAHEKVLAHSPKSEGKLPTITVVETAKGATFISSTGKGQRIDADYAKIKRAAKGDYVYKRQDFTHAGMQHSLISFKYDDRDRLEGETWLLREDGTALRINFGFSDKLEFKIDDGIVIIRGFERTIDLDHLNGEARFRAGAPRKVAGASGEEVKDPIGDTDSKFVDQVTQIRANPGSVFPAMEQETIRKMRIALGKREAGSIALVGESGTGKTQMIRSFVAGIARGEYPEIPRTTRVLTVDGMGLTSGTKYVGTFEAKLNTMVEACRRVPCLLFIDEIHAIIGAGTSEGNPNGVFQFLKTALADGTIRVLSTTTEEEFFNAFAGDPALMRRFTLVTKEAPVGDAVLKSLQTWSKTHGKPLPDKTELEYAVELSNKFNALGAQPAKTTALLDYAHSMKELEGAFNAKLTKDDLRTAAQALYQLDEAFFDQAKLKIKIDGLEAGLEKYVIGQKELKNALVRLTRQFYAGVHEESKPAIRILVAGPPGTGKTESARAYAEYMGLPFKRIEMTRYAHGDPAAFLAEIAEALRKNPFSVIAMDELEKANPKVQQAALGLLDSGVFTVSERLNSTSRGGERTVRVNARNATIVATTNAAAAFVLNKGKNHGGSDDSVPRMGFAAIQADREAEALVAKEDVNNVNVVEQSRLVDAIEKDGIPKVVVDRFQRTVAATAPTREEFRAVLRLHLNRAIKDQTARQKVTIRLTNEAEFLDAMLAKYYSEGMSNRLALDIVQNYFRSTLADALLSGALAANGELELHFDASTISLVPSCAEQLGR